MPEQLSNTMSLLARFPESLNALLRGLPAMWTHSTEGDQAWSAFDVIGHLNHLERNHWMARVRTVLDAGETRPFEAVDREAQRRTSQGQGLERLLDDFIRLRSGNLAELRALNLQPGDLALCGRHPAFGAVTLAQVLATWVVHDLTHLHQLSRIMAHQYRQEVGPWSQYLGVLHCEGHSRG